ncbi:hypothetical protein HPB51_019880 [Rhipicephalus microplus]|uniref:Syndetin C-terminal domain-containing protein n=1 Tax=Rhipicephalus microplus TaxID=6941 RepID=A0A9J6D6U9_RHIMP|nr:hypothetical protein HPB51_019880 [Rhipicephalus microplus]
MRTAQRNVEAVEQIDVAVTQRHVPTATHNDEPATSTFSQAKRCTPEGRAQMQLDHQQFVSKVEKLREQCQPLPDKELVEAYIKAYYLMERNLRDWIVEHSKAPRSICIGARCFDLGERSAISLTTQLLAAGTWKMRSRRTSMSMLVNAVCVDVISASVSMVTSYLNNSSQTSHLLGDDNDRHCVFIILHTQHISLTHVKNSLCLTSIGSRDSKGCDSHESTAVVHKHSR